MSFPTTLWGNLYDIYSAVPGPTSSSPGSSDGPVLGNAALLADGSLVQFFQFVTATTTAANMALVVSGNANLYKVAASGAVTDLVIAVNDLAGGSATNNNTSTSGGAVLVNYCAWAKRKGLAFPLVKANVAAGVCVSPTATAGTLDTSVAATHMQAMIGNTVVVGGSDAVSPCFMA